MRLNETNKNGAVLIVKRKLWPYLARDSWSILEFDQTIIQACCQLGMLPSPMGATCSSEGQRPGRYPDEKIQRPNGAEYILSITPSHQYGREYPCRKALHASQYISFGVPKTASRSLDRKSRKNYSAIWPPFEEIQHRIR